MSISRIELQGQITRAQDYTTIKHNEDNKVMVDQNNFQMQFNKTVDHKMNQVHHKENAENAEKRFDAKDKGNGEYAGDGGRQRRGKGKDAETAANVMKGYRGGFDIKI